ncbi:MAG TPA: urea carboxylase-associated family protein [Gemmataceae bacterium]|jgi:uncharacterized protein YcgI (DUF1989 family)|nr:urea carboxylase-associated family protein [Gemmataceae bacterium]
MADVDVLVTANTGAAFEVREGQVLTVSGSSIVDLVAFDLHDFRHRFDQARTKANQGKIYISTGDVLISKLNRDMLRIVEDTFTEGHHDLQYGMCGRDRWLWAVRQGSASAGEYYLRDRPVTEADFPDHGCFENISAAVKPYGIDPADIPAPFNIWQHMELDCQTGVMRRTKIRPNNGRLGLLALMDCLVALSACPDTAAGGKDVRVTVTY